MTRIFIILFAIITTGGLVYAGLCNMGGNASGHNSENMQHGQENKSCMMGEFSENGESCEFGGEGNGNGHGHGHGMQNMSDEEKGKRFQHMMGMKGEKMAEVSQNLEEIIDLADKVGYNTSKLKEYKIQLEKFQKEYGEFGEDMEVNIKMMCNDKQKRRGTNGNMRELMKNMSVEFDNIKNMK